MEQDGLVKIVEREFNGQAQPMVDARDLHGFLEVSTRYDTWMSRRIEEYEFVENSDFCTFLSKSTGGRKATEYLLTLDMAKELAMVERTEKGRLVRRYFIECERRFREMSERAQLPAATKPELEEVAEFFEESPIGISSYRAKLETVQMVFRMHGKSAATNVWAQLKLPALRGPAGDEVLATVGGDAMVELNRFAAECLFYNESSASPVSDVYRAYRFWAAQERKAPLGLRQFSRMMSELGYERYKSSIMLFRAVEIMDDAIPPESDFINRPA